MELYNWYDGTGNYVCDRVTTVAKRDDYFTTLQHTARRRDVT